MGVACGSAYRRPTLSGYAVVEEGRKGLLSRDRNLPAKELVLWEAEEVYA